MSELPQFPQWRSVEGRDKPIFDRFCRDHAPYAEATLATLLVWNQPDGCEISELHGNVVVRHQSCGGGRAVSLLGSHRTVDTVSALLDAGCGALELVPDFSVAHVGGDDWARASVALEPDRDNDDYVFDTRLLSSLAGRQFKGKRHRRNGFEEAHGPTLRMLDLASGAERGAIVACAEKWCAEVAEAGIEPPAGELEGIVHLLDLAGAGAIDGIEVFGVDVAGELVAFSVVEDHGTDTVSGVAFKARRSLPGAAEYLRSASAQVLVGRGRFRINAQQDLGHEGLRVMKQAYRPVAMLAKWKLTPTPEASC